LGVTLANADGWQNTLAQIAGGFLPLTVGAGSTTKVTDYYNQAAGWRVAFSGYAAHNGASGGGFALNLYGASGVLDAAVGGRLGF
jgi:hypothetical protein